MDLQHYLMLGAGLLVLTYAVWCRRGRSEAARAWVGSEMRERNTLVFWPAFAALLVLLGLFPVAETSEGAKFVIGLLFLLAVVAGFWGIFLPIPRWTTPGWYRTQTAYRKEARRKYEDEKRRAKRGESTTGDGS